MECSQCLIAVISCTVALFLSGYAIQQRTLRQLRASIRPRERRTQPQVYLPEQFRTSQVLEDGTVVEIESEIERERREQRERQEQQVIEVAPTVLDEATIERGKEVASNEKLAMVESLKAQAAHKSWGVDHPDPLAKSKVPVTRAERRRLIKEEIQRLSQPNERVYYQRRLW